MLVRRKDKFAACLLGMQFACIVMQPRQTETSRIKYGVSREQKCPRENEVLRLLGTEEQ